MNKIITKWSWLLPAVVLGLTISACGGDDDDDNINNSGNPEQPVDPTPAFTVQLQQFEKGIGSRLGFINNQWEASSIEGRTNWYYVTNADIAVYKSIEYEMYPTTGQAAQGIKQLVVTLADKYPATTLQLTEYLQACYMEISHNGDVWTFSNTDNTDRQDYVLTFTANTRVLHYVNVNEPPFTDFSKSMGKDIQTVGWGTVDATGSFLEYAPHGHLDGIINSVSMFADWAYNSNGQRLDYRAVQSITVEFLANLENDKIVTIAKYLRKRYDEPVSYASNNTWFSVENYEDRANNLSICLRGGLNREQKQSSNINATPVVGTVYQVLYSKLK